MFARCLSAIKQERTRAAKSISGPQKEEFKGDKKQFIDDLEQALYASKIISYTQGFMLMRETAKEVRFVERSSLSPSGLSLSLHVTPARTPLTNLQSMANSSAGT